MSRSYKKGYSSWHHTSEDKWARNVYSRCRRAKDNHTLRECEIFYRDCKISEDCSEAPDDRFCKNRIDYSVKFSDKWSWPSDGGSYYREDLATVRRDINEELFSEESNHYSHETIWDEYCNYRDARNVSKYNHTWKLNYEIPVGIELELDYWNSHKLYKKGMIIPPEDKECCYKVEVNPWDKTIAYLNKYNKVPVTEKFEKILDHSPRRGSDIPKNAIHVSIWRKDKWRYSQARSDWGLMSFLFYRNIIPTTFSSREEMTSWILKHNEEIANKWFRIKNRK